MAHKARAALTLAGLCAALTIGCGGGDSSSSTTASVPSTSTTTAARSTPAPRLKPSEDLAVICRPLAGRAEALIGGVISRQPDRLRLKTTRSLHLTGCRLEARDVNVHLTMDVAPDARQRYSNRMVESYQFGSGAGATSEGLRPRPVKGLGDPNVEGGGANWLPIYNQLLSVRGGQVLIVDFFVKGGSDEGLKSAAIRLSRQAYALLARGGS